MKLKVQRMWIHTSLLSHHWWSTSSVHSQHTHLPPSQLASWGQQHQNPLQALWRNKPEERKHIRYFISQSYQEDRSPTITYTHEWLLCHPSQVFCLLGLITSQYDRHLLWGKKNIYLFGLPVVLWRVIDCVVNNMVLLKWTKTYSQRIGLDGGLHSCAAVSQLLCDETAVKNGQAHATWKRKTHTWVL